MSGPLAGVRILDLSQVIAGPYGSVLLNQSGAAVIKVEPLQGEMGRTLAALFVNMNRGKRGVAINLQSPHGREAFYRLARATDVLIENFRPGVVERLEIDYERLAATNTGLVYASVSAFGSSGPYAHRPGFDPLLQAMAGTERAQGGDHNPPVFLRIPVTDYVSGLMTAAAITNALFRRARTGRGCHLQLSLLRSGLFINGDAFTRYPGRPGRLLPDAGQHGLGPLDRMYECADGWLFLLLPEGEEYRRRLALVPGLEEAASCLATGGRAKDGADGVAKALEEAFRNHGVEAWLARLEAAGVPCAPVITGYDRRFFEDVQPIVNRYFRSYEDAEAGHVEHVGNLIGFSATPAGQQGAPPPGLGQHTDEVLVEAGYSNAEIASLRADGIVL